LKEERRAAAKASPPARKANQEKINKAQADHASVAAGKPAGRVKDSPVMSGIAAMAAAAAAKRNQPPKQKVVELRPKIVVPKPPAMPGIAAMAAANAAFDNESEGGASGIVVMEAAAAAWMQESLKGTTENSPVNDEVESGLLGESNESPKQKQDESAADDETAEARSAPEDPSMKDEPSKQMEGDSAAAWMYDSLKTTTDNSPDNETAELPFVLENEVSSAVDSSEKRESPNQKEGESITHEDIAEPQAVLESEGTLSADLSKENEPLPKKEGESVTGGETSELPSVPENEVVDASEVSYGYEFDESSSAACEFETAAIIQSTTETIGPAISKKTRRKNKKNRKNSLVANERRFS
jgi:hypothetical protein